MHRPALNYSCRGGRYQEQSFNAKDSPFAYTVELGQVNYIGEVYYMSPKSASFWLSKYNVDMLLINDFGCAKKFMETYHPEIKLPFIANLLKHNEWQ